MKNNNNKNSSNSSKPSSTNGFKKVITNNRTKSNKKCGAQKGSTLTNSQIEELINNGEIDDVFVVEENKNKFNNHFKPIIRYEYDIKIKRTVIKHIIYPNKKTNISNLPVIYGNNIKTTCCLLYQKYMSLDGIQSYLFDAANNKLLTSKGPFYQWNKLISKKFIDSEYNYIKEKLMNSLVINVDESPIKINGEQYYLHNISDGFHTLQYVIKHRSQDDVNKFGFLNSYKGIIVHDHYKMYYNYGVDNAECNVHVLRDLNAVSKFTNHKWAKKLKELLLKMKDIKNELILNNKNKISKKNFNNLKSDNLKSDNLKILNDGINERNKDLSSNPYKKEEINLFNRLIKHCNNHLLFLKKFFVPFSNNRAEADLRGIKQKIGKFRSIEVQKYMLL